MEGRDVVEPIPVPKNVCGLLCAIAYGWTPAPMVLGDVEQLQYNGVDLSEDAQDLRLQENRLMVTLGGMAPDRLMPFALDGQLEGTLAGGARFHGDMVLRMGRSFSSSREEGTRRLVTIEAGLWTVLDGDAPSLWIGRIDGSIKINFSGNMIVERIASDGPRLGARRHFILAGAYAYYLVQCRTRDDAIWHLVIDTGGAGVPQLEILGRDFLALQFVLGRHLRMPELLGVSTDRRTIASTLGCTPRKNLEEHPFPPVPIEQDNEKWIDMSWAAVFFERVSTAWRARLESQDAFWRALEMYLGAMSNHLDEDYMRLQVALEAFAYWLLQHENHGEREDVKDKEEWKKWVKHNRDDIRAFAVEGREDALYQKVMTAYRFSSGKVVPSAFAAKGLALTQEMANELKGRDTVVHQGLMAPNGYEVERDLRRVALVRTMLIALIAKAADYCGAIRGWDVGSQGHPIEAPSGWWSVSENDRQLAAKTHIAEETVSV